MHRRIAALTALCCMPFAAWGGPAREASTGAEPVRGITLSTHGSGSDWASDRVVDCFQEMRQLGANWVCIHPYAGIGRDGAVRMPRRGGTRLGDDAPPESVARPIREAKALGMQILIKPHLAYWGTGWSWRGEIDFAGEADRQRFWTSYSEWILALARASEGCSGFAVGCETDRLLGDEPQWRRLIAAVRQALPGVPLTYCANWTDYQKVPFWDALDAIGVQAYFPLATRPPGGEPDADTPWPNPDRSDLDQAWDRWLGKLEGFASKHNRKVVFTELGYNRSFRTAAEPWSYETDGPEAEALQARCMAAALAALERSEVVDGAFLWKWFLPPRQNGRNFTLATPRMRQVIQNAWRVR